MLGIMLVSGRWAWYYSDTARRTTNSDRKSKEANLKDQRLTSAALRSLAIPQLVLVLLALTTYHVQIITRLSSGYPLVYWALVSLMMRYEKLLVLNREWNVVQGLTRWMVFYGLIQAGLFASFLPPA